MRTRLPEMLLVEVLRLHLATAPAVDHGWLAALRDPVARPGARALHAEHRRASGRSPTWPRATAVSRSQLDDRFRQVLGRSPIRYLTEWRMHLARGPARDAPTSGWRAMARRVGYDAEEAFSRAFKRASGSAPGAWRRAQSPR